MKSLPLIFLIFLGLPSANSQAPTANIAPRILDNFWKARWVVCPGESPKQYGVYHFRKTFDLKKAPASFVVHVSADNRYRLFVNGQPVSSGPARSDLGHWNFETVDIAPQLKAGKNTLAAIVWNAAEHAPFAQISYQTGFILQGNTEAEDLVNTDKTWRVLRNEAYRPLPVDRGKLQAYFVTGDGDDVDASRYPWGWEQPGFDDSKWKNAEQLWFAGKPRGLGSDGNWMLVPRSIPLFTEEKIKMGNVVRSNFASTNPGKAKAQATDSLPFVIPKNTKGKILIDQKMLVNAYPTLTTTGGKGAKITLTYAEALFDKNRQKGNRNEWEGKEIMGIQDRFSPDGGKGRVFRPLWFRTWRWLQLDIETGDEPLTINDLHGMSYGYPLEAKASFKSSDPTHEQIWKVGWRTAQRCAGETYFDCPYYEQLSYVGDTRIQALISLYVSGDDRLVRKSIEDFDNSRIPDGLTQSRYPCNDMQIIPTYSLFWVSMVYDYWMLRNDEVFVKKFRPGIEDVLAWEEARIAPNGMLGPVEWWNFVDWSWEWSEEERIGGVPPGVARGGSSILTLQYAYTLRQAAALFDFFGEKEKATAYSRRADSLVEATYRLCWDEARGMFADNPTKATFSQHANILAVLTDALPKAQQPALLRKIMADKSITQTTLYFRFYLLEALKKTGMGDELSPQLDDWRAMLDMGLTTFAEKPEPTRSDCHAWSAAPNYQLLSTVLGINTGSPGFGTVRIEPNLGSLTFAEGKMPHPLGNISVKLDKMDNGYKAVVMLPKGLDGEMVWRNERKALEGGKVEVLFFK
ncbi:MAG: alpha-L-rhamnosidase N-terminal domain-containing protein [Saprospiraceae bacterium]|nr:alpha-L-rhamnosidase N-terminal domain-containing protein [Saprospiraceae bacterium]MCF8249628.1 alpha-L-rhamnosidase N-terminal domain-containing protein [Saprospiraceae bacterium]MCF8280438.1 alpha-L-rhamnosidase N-terminal domain-containing protein [Bacteroidales bacterium]MCF8310460.1 alpha-L-rhamnosidase N-terminal domain-containing protein [Saprospiraceae bacterium]MCF8439838.1 alpha-L-rhamnosidase N-terminal domain-containing protein [Saprospiraceae bacterium]